MSQAITLELSVEAFAVLLRQAEDAGLAPAQLAAAALEQHYGSGPARDDATARRARFERQIGAIDLAHAQGTDNAAIDADLARAYECWKR